MNADDHVEVRLHRIAWATKRRLRCKMPELRVLSPARDPYFLSDGQAGAWFRDQADRFVPAGGTIHLRGLHCRIVVVNDVKRPDGRPYKNDADCWDWLQEVASKNARWLGYARL